MAAKAAGTAKTRRKADASRHSLAAPPARDRGSRSSRRKQAVVIVHGMGEQRPLETLRAFVEAVWGSRPTPRPEPSEDDIWLVPDVRAGLTELARVTTRANKHGVATDFYELYWSDLLVGNTIPQIRGWVFGLLWRWPHQVPRESFVLWLTLWAVTLVVLALAAYVGLTTSWQGLKDLVSATRPVHNVWTLAASVGLVLVLVVYFRRRLAANIGNWTNPDSTFPGTWAKVTPRQASMGVPLSRVMALGLPLAAAIAAYLWFPWLIFTFHKTWLLLFAAIIGYALTSWVVPVFGDVARYVRTSPDAVAARAQIRDRGVSLLRALHGAKDASLKDYDAGDPTTYERVVVVGHSLGSIVAYDILRLFWQEHGPTQKNPVTGDALAGLQAVDAFCRDALDDPEALDVAAFRRLQHQAADALAAPRSNWLISDFVTLGSPLSHAEFLVSRDRAAFEERKAERLFPTCPPMMEPGTNSFLYPNNPGKYAHHAAMFSVMRWTNIHDPDPWPFRGDFISGPCRPNFGPGVLDLPVRIDTGGLFGRLVTHTDYWNVEASGRAGDDVGAAIGIEDLSQNPKAHLAILRKAMALR